MLDLIGVLADVLQKALTVKLLFLPSLYFVVGLLILKPLEYRLVLHGDLKKLLLACISIK